MAMKTKTIQFVKASGLDQRWKGAVGYADQVVNMRVDPRGLGWVADRGVESWWKFPNPFSKLVNPLLSLIFLLLSGSLWLRNPL